MTRLNTSPVSFASSVSALALLAAVALGHAPALAERADRDKPMHIEADSLRHDELQQLSVFSGNVVLTKGSIVLRGAQLVVRQDAQGYQYGVVTAESGKRAFFRQKRDTAPGGPEEYVEGEAETIEYDGRKDDVRLIRRGQLRRYTNGKLTDDIAGNLITYNNLTDVFSVDGAASSTPGQGAASGRVRAVMVPKASAAPEGAAAQPSVPLQPAPRLQQAPGQNN